MIKTTRILIVLLLLFNGVSACFGGYMLISKPDGSGLDMPLSFLEHSPFSNYLIPGIVLLVMNGVLSLIVAVLVIIRSVHADRYTILQGAILTGWIVIQMIMLQTVNYLHIMFGSVGVLLMVSGVLMSKRNIVT
ncbi:MAG: hypothetical protein KF687_06865 [Cyclobacteriaceae bacterium]|nr:hypothetical protein [Cyclobacteriaceae bacterium]